MDIYSVYGPLYSVYVPKDGKMGYAVVQFYSKKCALAALHSTMDGLVMGQAKIKVNN